MSLRIATRALRPALRTARASIATTQFAAPAVSARALSLSARPTLRPINAKMASSLSTSAEVKKGDSFPAVEIKITDPKTTIDFASLKGKNVIVTVPGAFTPTCHSQVPSYVELYDQFKGKGVENIYVVAVNDMFVMNAWKKSLTGDKDTVKFAGDDQAKLAHALGLVLDATAGLGNLRLKRSVIVLDNGKVVYAAVEPDSSKSTITHADEVIKAI